MSKSALTTLLGVALSWLVVSCASTGLKSGMADSSMASTATTQPAPAVASVSPWTGSGIFFYPFLLICITFGISIYMSTGKTT